ncbi:MAG: hypothetical protein A2W80_08800 [Candidatus Riflebacteria bacterium GWC2_50_8]|nr:MAG: hypothetical protein A2W80_08800 [Candidatus Riflebacteria bacterium GWC2_50_8]
MSPNLGISLPPDDQNRTELVHLLPASVAFNQENSANRQILLKSFMPSQKLYADLNTHVAKT